MFTPHTYASRIRILVLATSCLAAVILAAPRAQTQPPKPSSASATPASRPPWAQVLEHSGELPAFRDTCFTAFDKTKSLTQDEELRQWFDVIAGQPQGIFETKSKFGKSGAIEGIVKLNAPWKEDMALRLALDDHNRLQVHFFRGDQGVTIVYHEDDLLRWAGYITTRKPRGVTPLSWALAATDDWRNRRTAPKNHDQYELRCHGGEIVLSRGDVVLLRAPLGGLPEDVFFQGKATFHGISVVRTRDFIPSPAPPPDGRVLRPAQLPWVEQLDEQARIERLPDGAVRLTASKATPKVKSKKRSWLATPIPKDAISELLLEVSDISPGSGIYLGNGKDGPRHVLRYVLDRRSRQTCILARPEDDLDEHEFRGLTEFPLPAVTGHHWLKLIFGAGQLRWWVSTDGVHWAEPAEPIRNFPVDVTHVGLHCANRPDETGITLRKLIIRELPHLNQLVEAELRPQAIAKADAPSLGAWLADVTELTPAGRDTNAWRRACAIRTLAAGSTRALGNELLMLLLEDESIYGLPMDQQLRILDEAALLLEFWDDNALLQRFAKRFYEVGQKEFERGGTPPFSAIRHALMTTPIASRQQLEIATEDLVRAELIDLVYRRQWHAIAQLARELRFFQLQQKVPLLDWAESLSSRQLPTSDMTEPRVEKRKDDWRDMLVEELNRDVYNLLAQLRVELSSPGREDAARAIAAIEAGSAQGVAPHWRDPQLLVSIPTAIRSAVQSDESLRRLLAEEYADLASLRVRQAIARGDVESVALAAEQFAPGEAAVHARLWLADVALASGSFGKAAAEYRAAWQIASPGLQTRIAGKLRLATTLAAQPSGTRLTGNVEIGDAQIHAEEFEKLVQELGGRVAKDNGWRVADVGPNSRSVPVPAPAGYSVNLRARVDTLVGNDPNREFARDTARRKLDWVDRQLGVAVDGNQMYVTNRFQVAAYDMQSKQRVWQTAAPPGQIQFAQESTFSVARPLLTRTRIYARLLYAPGTTLACIDRTNGQYVWTSTTPLNEEIISDPFLLQSEVACFKLVRMDQQEWMLRLVTFDAVTGSNWREHDVLRVRDSWRTRRYCEVVATEDGVIVALGGAVASLDGTGRVRWIRKSTVLPPEEEPHWVTQFFQPPFVTGDRLYLSQPGVRTLECLDRHTGERVWSRLFLDVERVIGVVGPLLICQTSTGLTGLQLEDGTTKWSHEAEELTVGVTCGREGDVLYVQRVPTDAARSRYRPRLVWLDSTTGRARASTPLAELEDADPRIGPLVVDQDRLWTFWGKGQNEPTRDVVELLPKGAAEVTTVGETLQLWTRHLDTRLLDANLKAVPQWRVLHAEFGDASGLLAEIHGEREALGLRFRNTGPIAIGREVTIPANTKPKLRLRFGNEVGHSWKVEVRFRGQPVWSQEVNATTHPQPWKLFEVDLAQIAGQQGWLTIRGSLPQGGDAPSYWKTIEIVF